MTNAVAQIFISPQFFVFSRRKASIVLFCRAYIYGDDIQEYLLRTPTVVNGDPLEKPRKSPEKAAENKRDQFVRNAVSVKRDFQIAAAVFNFGDGILPSAEKSVHAPDILFVSDAKTFFGLFEFYVISHRAHFPRSAFGERFCVKVFGNSETPGFFRHTVPLSDNISILILIYNSGKKDTLMQTLCKS